MFQDGLILLEDMFKIVNLMYFFWLVAENGLSYS